ncbi:MAG: curli assembly protein CsgG [Proteobacteria bacterium]|nr:curli assembly protein CsgG [Pseudomonadota bacterium]
MKTICTLLFAFLLATPVFAAAPPLTVAVFNFEATDEGLRDVGPKIAVLLNALLSAEGDLITLERAELEKALGEQELGLSGTVKAETAAKVGQLTGAKVLVTGRVFKAGNETLAVAKIISTETSRVYGEIARGNASASLSDLATELAGKIAKTITTKGDTLVAKVVTRDERLAALKKALPAGKRPTVLVRIPEVHFGTPAVDPAAETEIGLILRECGFTLVDDKSKTKPDFEILGEAFSERGPRRGNLQTCKARVELKIRNVATGTLIVDRQTSVMVDISEHIAAKTALQNAGAELAERIAPKLLK